MKPVTKNKLIEDTLANLLVLGKRYIYSTRMAETIPTPITIKHELVARIKILTLLRSSLSLNFSISKLSAEYIENSINWFPPKTTKKPTNTRLQLKLTIYDTYWKTEYLADRAGIYSNKYQQNNHITRVSGIQGRKPLKKTNSTSIDLGIWQTRPENAPNVQRNN